MDEISQKRVLVTGAAGNLGGMLSRYIAQRGGVLRLMVHKKGVSESLRKKAGVSVCRADLADTRTLPTAFDGVDTVVHFAGVLFRARPERFLPTTNTDYFRNLLEAAVAQGVKRVVLVSFPHVEGETTPENPACGRLDGQPQSVHARTRGQQERDLMACAARHGVEPVILRVGMVYGRGVLMMDAARWFSRRGMLGVWKRPTWIHLISKPDFLEATFQAVYAKGVSGIYHLGDEGVQTLQEFLDVASGQWRGRKPWRMPLWMIYAAAFGFERLSQLTGCRAVLTGDFITIGRMSYYGETRSMREKLLPTLRYRNFCEGLHTL